MPGTLEGSAERERLPRKLVLGVRQRMAERDLALLAFAQRELGLHLLVIESRQHRYLNETPNPAE